MSKKKRKQGRKKKSGEPRLLGRFSHRTGGIVILIVIVGIFTFHALALDCAHDDAFVMFRYAENFAHGRGLVLNIGEKVEGYASFLWTVLLGLVIKLGGDPVPFSKSLGVIFGCGALVLTYVLSKRVSSSSSPVFYFPAVLMLASNGSFALWTTSGMETSLFLFLTLAGIVFYLSEWRGDKRIFFSPFFFALASVTRPEGILFFGITLLHRWITSRMAKKFDLRNHVIWLFSFLVIVVPHILWRISYYAYPFPNTFYARGGISWSTFSSGLAYTAAFLQQYWLWGIAVLLPIVVVYFRRDRFWYWYFLSIILAFMLYVTCVGGDRLPENRFFVPIVPLMYLCLQEGLVGVYRRTRKATVSSGRRRSSVAFVSIVFLFAGYTAFLPMKSVLQSRHIMTAIVAKYRAIADYIRGLNGSKITIAATGVGALSYYSRATVIDMVGMNDSYIAHHPERIEGLSAQNAEQKYNAPYVLSRKPDFIYFVTAWMPSELAEKALFACADFRQGYYLSYLNEGDCIFKRKRRYERPNEEIATFASVEFIEHYYNGFRSEHDPRTSLYHFQKSIGLGPKDFAYPYEFIGKWYEAAQEYDDARKYYERAIEIDDHCLYSRLMLAKMSIRQGDLDRAIDELSKATEIEPDYFLSHDMLGTAHRVAGNTQAAITEFEKAIELNPTYADSYYKLGFLYCIELEDHDKGMKLWEHFLRLDPDSERARDVALKMKELRGEL